MVGARRAEAGEQDMAQQGKALGRCYIWLDVGMVLGSERQRQSLETGLRTTP